jgi:hypothetical protein
MASTVTHITQQPGSNGIDVWKVVSDSSEVATDIACGFRPTKVEIIGTADKQLHTFVYDAVAGAYVGIIFATTGDILSSTALTWSTAAGGTLTASTEIITDTCTSYFVLTH